MPSGELEHLTLLADVDSLIAELRGWSSRAPEWPPARQCASLVTRLTERTDTLRVRLQAPLVVATLGGTGTGKSTLVNAIAGEEVTQAGRERPTTRRPTLICSSRCTAETFGFRADEVHVIERDLPALHDLVILDCPDPDTTEDPESAGTNLARLRRMLPYCDVLLVTTTQQKYRSARVLDEMASAAPGARLVFVQTHADTSDDVREDWRLLLSDDYRVGDMFFLDSLQALKDAKAGLEPRGEFARLMDLLTRELAGTAANRIRRANFLDLVHQTLGACRSRLDAGMPAIEQLEAALAEQRLRVSAQFTRSLRTELMCSQRPWENRLLAEVTRRWGFSPFSLVLRGYQGLGGIFSGWALMRARTPAQIALWGIFEGGRLWKGHQQRRQTSDTATRAAALSLEQDELRTAAIIVDGYVSEANLPLVATDPSHLAREAQQAAAAFIGTASVETDRTVSRLADRHTGWFTRFRYELLLALMLGVLLYRMGKNFFWDSWLAPETVPVYGIDFFIAAGIWLWLWSTLLVWAFTRRLRRGLRAEINSMAERCASPISTASIFGQVERECRTIRHFRHELEHLLNSAASMKARLEQPETRLGHRVVE
jgi:hypothetical protein